MVPGGYVYGQAQTPSPSLAPGPHSVLPAPVREEEEEKEEGEEGERGL